MKQICIPWLLLTLYLYIVSGFVVCMPACPYRLLLLPLHWVPSECPYCLRLPLLPLKWITLHSIAVVHTVVVARNRNQLCRCVSATMYELTSSDMFATIHPSIHSSIHPSIHLHNHFTSIPFPSISLPPSIHSIHPSIHSFHSIHNPSTVACRNIGPNPSTIISQHHPSSWRNTGASSQNRL